MLKIERRPTYLSPSSLSNLEKMPNTSYLTRLIEDRFMRDDQSLAAAVGTSFDIKVKEKLIEDKLVPVERAQLLPDIRSALQNHHTQANILGDTIMKEYTRLIYDDHSFVDVEMHRTWNYCGIPIMTKADASIMIPDWDKPIVHDFKCSGFGNNHGMSPKPGFAVQAKGDSWKPAHKKWHKNIRMEEIDKTWASQFATYGWALGYSENGEFESFPVSADMITITKTKKIAISHYVAWITIEFQRELFNRYKAIWNSIQDSSYLKNIADTEDLGIVALAALSERWF